MEIYVPIKIPVLRGHTKIELFDHDEIHRMEPKYVQEKPNAIQDELLQKLTDEMQSSTSGNTAIHMVCNWAQKYPGYDDQNTTQGATQNEAKNGIFARVNDITGWVKEDGENNRLEIKDFMLNTNQAVSGATNQCIVTGEAEWGTGTSGSMSFGADTSVSYLYLGKDYAVDGQSSANEGFGNNGWASNNITDFTMETQDVLKVTWTITIGS
jgi:hypothetical protein